MHRGTEGSVNQAYSHHSFFIQIFEPGFFKIIPPAEPKQLGPSSNIYDILNIKKTPNKFDFLTPHDL